MNVEKSQNSLNLMHIVRGDEEEMFYWKNRGIINQIHFMSENGKSPLNENKFFNVLLIDG